jgi:hypothetical protein
MKLLGMFRHKVSKQFIFSFVFFFICLLLDYSVTNVLSQGDFTMEANPAVQLWWQILGPFRHIEVLLWPLAVFVTAYIIDSKSHFLPLLWLNMLAFNHLLGVLTWLPNGNFDFVYSLIKYDWVLGYTTTLIGLLISLPFTFLQTKINLRKTT